MREDHELPQIKKRTLRQAQGFLVPSEVEGQITTNIHGNSCKNKLPNVLGDVVVSAETARREARKRKVPIQKEICLYLVHGILHLLGYDDKKSIDRKRMRAKEKELLGTD
ncbi:MAG: rRNA maturation RNase YbeY, partial [Candidatus Omnitrophica bacterium]|nr:rRNA maturation RNase YbeY [Candidatus Omnitrophota bacterium]